MSWHVVHRGKCDENFGVVTYSTYKSKEDYDEWMKGSMKDGTNRPLTAVYETAFESENHDEVRAFMDGCKEESRFWAFRSEMMELQRMKELMPEGEELPDFVVSSSLMKVLMP